MPKIGKNIMIAAFIAMLITASIPIEIKAESINSDNSAMRVNYYNYAPYFTANNSYVSINDNPNLRLEQFSIAAWFKTDMTNNKEMAIIVNKGGFSKNTINTPNQNYGIWLTGTNQGVAGKIQAGFEDSNGNNYFVTTRNTYNDNNWHYVVVTYDKSILKLYVDNVLVTSKNTNAIPAMNSMPLVIGKDSNTNKRYFKGYIDEVRVYDRALTAQEISDTYNNGITANDYIIQATFSNPIVDDKNILIRENSSVDIILSGIEQDNYEELAFFIVNNTSNGVLSTISPIDSRSARVTYTPTNNYHGIDKFTYRARDSNNAYSNTATVTIEVMPMFGVNLHSKILRIKQDTIRDITSQEPNIQHIMQEIKSLGLNTIRLNLYWESYRYHKSMGNEEVYFAELENIASTADSLGIGIIYNVMHQWYISSYYKTTDMSAKGIGFPHELVSYLGSKDSPVDTNITRTINGKNYTKYLAYWFWYDFFNNNQTIDNKPVWQALWDDYYSKIVLVTKDHKSTIGYALLNEPNGVSNKEFDDITINKYRGLGQYYAFLTSNIEELLGTKNNKIIILNEIQRTWRDPDKLKNIKLTVEPAITILKEKGYTDEEIGKKLWFDAHSYAEPDSNGNFPQSKKQYLEKLKDSINLELFIGEWNSDRTIPLTPEYATSALNAFKEINARWAFFGYNPSKQSTLKDTDYSWKTDPQGRRFADMLRDAINAVY